MHGAQAFFLLFENSNAVADFDTNAVSKSDQKWRILTRRKNAFLDDEKVIIFDGTVFLVRS